MPGCMAYVCTYTKFSTCILNLVYTILYYMRTRSRRTISTITIRVRVRVRVRIRYGVHMYNILEYNGAMPL
jgi:hypothetical protein